MNNRRKTGSTYEQLAARHLETLGYTVLQSNYRCCFGEIDLVARQGGYLVFVEVKYRRHAGSGSPADAVDGRKQRAVVMAAQHYIMRHHISDQMPIRFDVVSVLGSQIRVFENAFDGW